VVVAEGAISSSATATVQSRSRDPMRLTTSMNSTHSGSSAKVSHVRKGKGMKKAIGSLAALLLALAVVGLATASNDQRNFKAHLTGGEEVPARDTPAQGQATFKLSKDGTALHFKVIVANIENVAAAHIHCGSAGVNGPVGVTLFAGAPGGGRFNGVLAEGTSTAPDPGNACGWADLNAVVAALRSGNTYVNVHTNDGVPPPNTGPGDFPGGEIRGQVD
jgi:CHRD domain